MEAYQSQEELLKQLQGGGGATSGSGTGAIQTQPASSGTQQTFSQLQQQGVARPPQPQTYSEQNTAQSTGGQTNPYSGQAAQPAPMSIIPPVQPQTQNLQGSGVGMGYTPYNYAMNYSQVPQGGSWSPPDIAQNLYGQYAGYGMQMPFMQQAQGQMAPQYNYQMQQYNPQMAANPYGYQQFQGGQNQQVMAPMQQNSNYQPQNYQSTMAPPQQQIGQFNGTPMSNFTPTQYNPVGAPNAQLVGQFQAPPGSQQATMPFNGTTPLAQQTQNAAGQALANPSAYNAPQVQQTFEMLNRQLGQGYDVERQKINEEMAKRGIYFSSIAGGRLGDLATNQANAQRDLATQLATQAAQTYGSDRANAIQSGLNVGQQGFGNQLAAYNANLTGAGQNFSQGLQAYNANMGAANQNFQNQLAQAAFQGDQNAQQALSSLNNAQFGLGQQSQNYNQGLSTYNANANATNQNFANALANATFNSGQNQFGYNAGLQNAQFGLGQNQQNYAQQLANSQFNQSEAQRLYGQNLQGYSANLGAQQQAYNQQQQSQQFRADELAKQLQYGLTGANQQFQNQLASTQANNALGQQQYANQYNNWQANQAAQQQSLNNYLGYGQQGFNNQMAQAQFNNTQQQQYQQLLMSLLGAGGTA